MLKPVFFISAGRDIKAEWYPNGPDLSLFPMPIGDQLQTWGSDCSKCKGACSGHYLDDIAQHLKIIEDGGKHLFAPIPSVFLSSRNRENKGEWTSQHISEAAQKSNLSVAVATMWIQHLQQCDANKLRGIENAKKTRAAKKGQ